jgi:hypothetical protein
VVVVVVVVVVVGGVKTIARKQEKALHGGTAWSLLKVELVPSTDKK